eukprot:366572-Chlamydomonas_euryale.AAC.1
MMGAAGAAPQVRADRECQGPSNVACSCFHVSCFATPERGIHIHIAGCRSRDLTGWPLHRGIEVGSSLAGLCTGVRELQIGASRQLKRVK